MTGQLQRFLPARGSHVTCRGRDDGAGAQAVAAISTMIFARLRGIGYAHTPFAEIAHRPPESSAEDWAARWEEFFNLGDGETPAATLSGLPEAALRKPHRTLLRSNRLYVAAHCHKVTDHHPDAWAAIAPELRRRYEASSKPDLAGFDPAAIQLAFHIRRGDVGPAGTFSERFTPDSLIRRRVEVLIDALGPAADRAVLRIFSQGRAGDFAFLEGLPVAPRLHLDDDPFTTFHHLVRSDVVVTAKSSFSWLAALLGGGTVLHEPFWHPALPGWHPVDRPPDLRARFGDPQAAEFHPPSPR